MSDNNLLLEDDDFYDEDEFFDEEHVDDDGEPCNCIDQECGYSGAGEAICPECDSDDFDLVCGDHGCRCNKCGAEFTCP